MKKLAIITVNYNNYKDTDDFIESFDSQTNKSFHIFVIDVSPDPEIISTSPHVTKVCADNHGYAYGLNTGYAMARQEGYTHFVFINNDTLVSKTFVAHTLEAIQKHPASLIGGKIYYAKGYEYHKDRYSKKDEGSVFWYAGGSIDWAHAIAVHRGVDIVDKGQYDTPEKTTFITGCLMCFDDAFVQKAGQMDDSYFLYYEDADWCARATKMGVDMFYEPSIIIYHKNSQSTGGSGSALHINYQEKNRIKFGMRYAPLRTKFHLLKNSLLHKK